VCVRVCVRVCVCVCVCVCVERVSKSREKRALEMHGTEWDGEMQ
jgi:hypothetical protein